MSATSLPVAGDWENTRAILEAYPDFATFPGAEIHLLKAMQRGAAGCISATANVNLPAIKRIYDGWRGPDAEDVQARASAYRAVVQRFPVIPALKAIVAHRLGDANWTRTRPPLRRGRNSARPASDCLLYRKVRRFW